MMRAAWTVFRKELIDALRDRRTLTMVLISSVAMGPLVLVLISGLVANLEKRAEERTVLVLGIEHAPTLANYVARQTWTVKAPPADWERQLAARSLGDAVVVVPREFEAQLQAAEAPLVEIVSHSANQRAQASAAGAERLLRGFNREQATLRLAWRGVAPALLEPMRVEDRDLADSASRSAQLAFMVPYFVLMAVLYGAMNAALDTTAGERERGSLEPLLMNPAGRGALVAGKWAAVAAVAMLIALLSCLSFLPGQWLIRSEALSAMFRFGSGEALRFVALLLPLAAALSALLMAVAIRCKSFKEAQANATIVILVVSMLPLVLWFGQDGEKPWHLWVPALAQSTLMARVLKGEAVPPIDAAQPLAVAVVLTLAALAYVAHKLRSAALK
jgi:sodium transport system permease protein